MWFLENNITFERLIIGMLVILFIVFVVFPVKQYVYARTAVKLGDDTPKLLGKLTLNPAVHFDFFGSVFLMIFGMGWPKNVVVNTSNLKNRRKDLFLIGITSPLVHIAFAFACVVIFKILKFALPISVQSAVLLFMSLFIYFNVMFTVYEFLPIDPFKGFYIFQVMMSEKVFGWYTKNYIAVSLVIYILLIFGFFNGVLRFLQGFLYYSFIMSLLI